MKTKRDFECRVRRASGERPYRDVGAGRRIRGSPQCGKRKGRMPALDHARSKEAQRGESVRVVYCGQIESSIMSQLRAFAVAKKVIAGETVYVGTVDADDLGRIASGYPGVFK